MVEGQDRISGTQRSILRARLCWVHQRAKKSHYQSRVFFCVSNYCADEVDRLLIVLGDSNFYWAHLCPCTVGSYASLSICLDCLDLTKSQTRKKSSWHVSSCKFVSYSLQFVCWQVPSLWYISRWAHFNVKHFFLLSAEKRTNKSRKSHARTIIAIFFFPTLIERGYRQLISWKPWLPA